ncbi:MAG TPA: D-2-hydroxyacid dehydrogenase [Burkholderiaceae bacterium]|nr:D-2-hydroxyacid dehydrogenase [Burkholderiaceae bacterium]
MKIVVWSRIAEALLLERLGPIQGLEPQAVRDFASLPAALADADILLMPGGDYSRTVADIVREHAARLKFIQLVTAGYEGLEDHGVPAGVIVANAGDSWSPSVAEQAMMLMLALIRKLPMALDAQSRRVWESPLISPRMRSLNGRTLVIVGYGSIGREVAQRARGFGMRIVGVSRRALPDALLDEVRRADELDTVLSQADVVLVAVPSGARTRGLIGATQLAACKPGALLINVARGNVVDRAALIDALTTGRLAGAGIDVTDPEPLPTDDPLWSTPNLIITPHVSGASGPEGFARLADIVCANVARFVAGQAPLHQVQVPLPSNFPRNP